MEPLNPEPLCQLTLLYSPLKTITNANLSFGQRLKTPSTQKKNLRFKQEVGVCLGLLNKGDNSIKNVAILNFLLEIRRLINLFRVSNLRLVAVRI